MKKHPLIWKSFADGIVFLFVGTALIPAIAQDTGEVLPTSRGNWLYVGGNGPGNFTSIQDAIYHATDGDTIFVYNGTYYENLLIDKKIYLLGEDLYNTIIDGYQYEFVIIVIEKSNGTEIKGFTIRNTSVEGYGILINTGHQEITISNNLIRDCFYGIGSWHNTLLSINNNIINNTESGIILQFTDHSDIASNQIINNSYGIIIDRSSCNSFYLNEIKNNEEIGLTLYRSWCNNIERNNFIENGAGPKTQAGFLNCLNHFKGNYWSDRKSIPIPRIYAISGKFGDDWNPGSMIPWIQFDIRADANPHPIEKFQ